MGIEDVLLGYTPEEMADHLRAMASTWKMTMGEAATQIHSYLGRSDEESDALKRAVEAGLSKYKEPAFRRPTSRDRGRRPTPSGTRF